MCLLKGYAGVGKTVLAETVREHVEPGYFLYGKYDEIRPPQPFYGFVDAFSALHETLERRDDLSAIRNDVECKIGEDFLFLRDLCPRIIDVLDVDRITSSSQQQDASSSQQDAFVQRNWVFERMKVALRDFIRVLAKHGATIALVIDDLQWADASSLELLQYLLTDKRVKGLLFVGVYRDYENVAEASPQLQIRMREILDKSPFQQTHIEVKNLSENGVNDVIADVLALAPGVTQALAHAVFGKTRGNAFHTLQFLGRLKDDYLVYRGENGEWDWHLEDIRSDTREYNVEALVSHQMVRFDDSTKVLLRVASCFGSHFYINVVDDIVRQMHQERGDQGTHSTFQGQRDESHHEDGAEELFPQEWKEVLDNLIHKGLVRGEVGKYLFTHDKVRQAAYNLFEDNNVRLSMHRRIGIHLQNLHNNSETRQEWMFLASVDQLNLGCELTTEEEQQLLKFAKLNLRAAKIVSERAAFAPALDYLNKGVEMLRGMDGWNHHYKMQLQMQSARAQVLYCIGNMDECEECCDEVIDHARKPKDKHEVWIVKIDALGSSLKFSDALHFGFQVLRDLGEKFPRKPRKQHLILAFLRTSLLLRGKTDNDLLGLRDMKDHSKLCALEVISSLAMHAFPFNKEVEVGLLIIRMIQITLKHGLSKHSSRAFSAWAYLQGSFFKFEESLRFARLADKLVVHARSHFRAGKDCEGRSVLTNSVFVWHLREALSKQFDHLLKSHQFGMETGDIVHASLAAGCYTMAYFFSGCPLGRLLEDAKVFEEQQKRYKQAAGAPLVVVYHQAALNLMGQSANPVVLTGDAMNQEEYLRSLNANTARIKVQTLWLGLLIVSSLYGDTQVAGETAEQLWKFRTKVDGPSFYIPGYLMFMSIACLDFWRNSGQRKFKKQSRLHLKELETWVKKEAANTKHKLLLLQTEHEVVKQDRSPAQIKVLYDDAIYHANRAGFTQDAAFACERAGKFFRGEGDSVKGYYYLRRATEFYFAWEAWGKTRQMLQTHWGVNAEHQQAPEWIHQGMRATRQRNLAPPAPPSVWGMGIRERPQPMQEEWTADLPKFGVETSAS